MRIGRTALVTGFIAAKELVHCHILEHEDSGKMVIVEVVP